MIDLRFVREHPDAVRASQRTRGADESLVDALLAADAARREAVKRADDLRGEQKAASQAVRGASKEERPAVLEKAKALAAAVKEAEEAERSADATWSAGAPQRRASRRADGSCVASSGGCSVVTLSHRHVAVRTEGRFRGASYDRRVIANWASANSSSAPGPVRK